MASIEDGAWKQQPGMSMGHPEPTRRLECQLRQNHVPILATFAVANVNPVLATTDITNLKLQTFAGSQAQAINHKQEDAVKKPIGPTGGVIRKGRAALQRSPALPDVAKVGKRGSGSQARLIVAGQDQ